MAKTKTGKNVVVTRLGQPVDLLAWLNETKEVDGKQVLANVDERIHAELSKGETFKGEGKDKDRIVKVQSENYVLTIELSKRKLPATKDGKHYDMEYADIRPRTGHGCTFLVDGKLDPWFEKNKDGSDKEMPSLTKYFAQGFSMVARNAASTRIQAAVEGPDKMLNQTIAKLMKQKGFNLEKATKVAHKMMALVDAEKD